MSMEEAKFWMVVGFQIINALASSGLWLYVRYGDRNAEVDRKFDTLRDEFDSRMDEQDKTIAHLRGLAERAPTHSDLAQLYEKVNTTAQNVSSIAGQMQGMNDTLKLILHRIAERGMP